MDEKVFKNFPLIFKFSSHPGSAALLFSAAAGSAATGAAMGEACAGGSAPAAASEAFSPSVLLLRRPDVSDVN